MRMTLEEAHNIARDAYQQGDLLNAEKVCMQILSKNAEHFETRLLLGMVKYDRGHTAKARQVLSKLHEEFPEDMNVLYLLALTEQQLKQYPTAVEHYKTVIDKEPKHANAQFMYLLMLESLNELDEAEKHLKTLSKDDPSFVYMAAIIKRRRKKYDEGIKLLRGLGTDHPEPLMIRINFELGRCLDLKGEYDEAFECFQTAHQLSVKIMKEKNIKTGKNFFVRELDIFGRIFNTPDNTQPTQEQPATVHFLVGFPRSGTTLLTQMLDAHPGIEVMDEFPFLRRTYNKAIRMLDGKPIKYNTDLGPYQIAELQEMYMQSLRAYIKEYTDEDEVSPDTVYIDKMPMSLVLNGFVHKLFPKAKFILSLRHPCDCALSNYMQHYQSNAAMENMRDLGDIVTLYTKCFDLFLSTAETLKQDVHQVRYEDLIENFEDETAKICDFLGVDNAPEIKNYRETVLSKKSVSTPSYQQITEPLYTKSKYRWLNYKKHFDPYIKDLEPYIEKFGYKEK